MFKRVFVVNETSWPYSVRWVAKFKITAVCGENAIQIRSRTWRVRLHFFTFPWFEEKNKATFFYCQTIGLLLRWINTVPWTPSKFLKIVSLYLFMSMNQTLCTCLTTPLQSTFFGFCLQVFLQAGLPRREDSLTPWKYCWTVFPKNTTTHCQFGNGNDTKIHIFKIGGLLALRFWKG